MTYPRTGLFAGFTTLVALLFLADLIIGPVDIPFQEVFSVLTGRAAAREEHAFILNEIRIPKALAALICGAGLSVCGLLTQSLFRNPLTGPDVLGLTSGAGLGVAFSILAGISGEIPTTLAAFSGAACSFLLISSAATKVSNNTLLILGLMISAFTSSIISVLQVSSESSKLQQYTIWTMGNITIPSGSQLVLLFGAVIFGFLTGFSALKSLNASTLGEQYLHSMGLNPKLLRWKVLLAASLVTGAITAICGPITFVGIAGPHLIKQLFRITDHRLLLPLSGLTGAALVLCCDLLAQLPGEGNLLPLNAVTALFGAPVIIWVILRQR